LSATESPDMPSTSVATDTSRDIEAANSIVGGEIPVTAFVGEVDKSRRPGAAVEMIVEQDESPHRSTI
jgi:hypothetical protein